MASPPFAKMSFDPLLDPGFEFVRFQSLLTRSLLYFFSLNHGHHMFDKMLGSEISIIKFKRSLFFFFFLSLIIVVTLFLLHLFLVMFNLQLV